MQDTPGVRLIREVMATADVFLRESHRLFRPHGLTAAQFNALNVIGLTEGGLSQRELSDRLVVDRSNVTGLLDRLERAGWVKRSDDPKDRRIYRITLTPAGRRLWKQVSPRYDAVVAQVAAGVSDAKAGEALETLRSLQEGAKTWRLSK
jgi:MarR family 2-MHQ and catechol resistance regulon transcriptional repressor